MPTKKQYLVDYWCCGDDSHRHRTERAALRCEKNAPSFTPAQLELERVKRRFVVTKAVLEGATFAEAGSLIGVGPQQAFNLYSLMLARATPRSILPLVDNYRFWATKKRELPEGTDAKYWIDQITKFADTIADRAKSQ